MSGFLDRVVTLALGTAPVAHPRHEPMFASPARSRPEADEFGSEAEDVGAFERPRARRSRARRIASYGATEADYADVGERSGERGLPEARSRARDDANAEGAAELSERSSRLQSGLQSGLHAAARRDGEGRELAGDAEAGEAGSIARVTARGTSRLGWDSSSRPGPRRGPLASGAFVSLNRTYSPDAPAERRGPPAPGESSEGSLPREERSHSGGSPSQSAIGRDSGIHSPVRGAQAMNAQAIGRSADRGNVEVGGDSAGEWDGGESGSTAEREGRQRLSAIGTGAGERRPARAEDGASGEALHVGRPPSRSLADPERAGRADEDDVTINVSIGRIDVVRPAPQPVSPYPAAGGPARPSLDDYLRLREKVRGR